MCNDTVVLEPMEFELSEVACSSSQEVYKFWWIWVEVPVEEDCVLKGLKVDILEQMFLDHIMHCILDN